MRQEYTLYETETPGVWFAARTEACVLTTYRVTGPLSYCLDWIAAAERARRNSQDRESVNEAVRKFHVERGCCDGTFTEPCPWKATQAEQRAKTDDREYERRDAEAFRNASLEERNG